MLQNWACCFVFNIWANIRQDALHGSSGQILIFDNVFRESTKGEVDHFSVDFIGSWKSIREEIQESLEIVRMLLILRFVKVADVGHEKRGFIFDRA